MKTVTAPQNAKVSATLSWSASTDNIGVSQYRVSVKSLDGSINTLATTSTNASWSLYGSGSVELSVVAVDSSGEYERPQQHGDAQLLGRSGRGG